MRQNRRAMLERTVRSSRNVSVGSSVDNLDPLIRFVVAIDNALYSCPARCIIRDAKFPVAIELTTNRSIARFSNLVGVLYVGMMSGHGTRCAGVYLS
jgi:hypothetical protein